MGRPPGYWDDYEGECRVEVSYAGEDSGVPCEIAMCYETACHFIGDDGHGHLSVCDTHAEELAEALLKARFERRSALYEGPKGRPKRSG